MYAPRIAGFAIGLDASTSGVIYQLIFSGSGTIPTTTVSGTGSAVNFPVQTQAGTYTVIGYITGLQSCTTTFMTGSKTITYTNPVITAFSTSASSPCVNTAATVMINSSTLVNGTTYTVNYTLSGAAGNNAVSSATMVYGTGFGSFSIPGSQLTLSGATTVTINSITAAGCTTTAPVTSPYAASFTVVPPASAPSAATGLSLTPTATTATVSFTPPGTAPTGYVIVSSPGALTGTPTNGQAIANGPCTGTNGAIIASGSSSPFLLTGLTANTTYTLTVFPDNHKVSSFPAFGPGLTGTVTTCAGTPAIINGAATSTTLPISFTAAAGGNAISPYTYSLKVCTDAGMTIAAPGYPLSGTTITGPSYTISGLNPVTTYYYTITVTGACSATSVVTSNTTICAVPGVPTNFSYSNDTTTSVTVSFTPPGTAPTGYILVSTPGVTPLSGLPVNGTAYTVGLA